MRGIEKTVLSAGKEDSIINKDCRSSPFVGEDLIFTHIHEDQFCWLFCVIEFIIDGFSIIRICAECSLVVT